MSLKWRKISPQGIAFAFGRAPAIGECVHQLPVRLLKVREANSVWFHCEEPQGGSCETQPFRYRITLALSLLIPPTAPTLSPRPGPTCPLVST